MATAQRFLIVDDKENVRGAVLVQKHNVTAMVTKDTKELLSFVSDVRASLLGGPEFIPSDKQRFWLQPD